MKYEVELPIEWLGQLPIRVGDEIDVICATRVVRIEEEQVDITEMGRPADSMTLGGETLVTLRLRDLRMHPDEAARVVLETR